jgi:hypothetical protein
VGRFDISPEVAAEYREKFRGSVAPFVGEDVLAAGPFRQTGAGTRYGISKAQAGALAYGASKLFSKKQAGGLPGKFLLAVTPSRLYAFKYKQKRDGIEAKEEVGAWDRAGLEVTTERLRTTTRVTVELPDGEKIVCDQEGIGDNPWADDVVAALQG